MIASRCVCSGVTAAVVSEVFDIVPTVDARFFDAVVSFTGFGTVMVFVESLEPSTGVFTGICGTGSGVVTTGVDIVVGVFELAIPIVGAGDCGVEPVCGIGEPLFVGSPGPVVPLKFGIGLNVSVRFKDVI